MLTIAFASGEEDSVCGQQQRVMTFLSRLNRAEIIQSVARVIFTREILTSLLAGGLRQLSHPIFSVSMLQRFKASCKF